MINKEIEKFISWGRYLYWSNILKCRFKDYIKSSNDVDDPDGWYSYALMSQWYASVWVVIEGWKEIKIKDDVIDRLLSGWPDYCDLLKKYRNVIYHYQSNVTDSRFVALLKKGDKHVFWIQVLFDEFQRFFWEWPEKITNSKKLAEEMREDIKGSIGWIPTDIFPVRKKNLEKLAQECEQLLSKYGDYESPKAVNLIDTITSIRQVISETPDNLFLNNLDQNNLDNGKRK